ncbi:hypothetical protein OV450_3959 [Actinobacteria bacterium OV450]|nr:hypothetical protein OV450_3959 [Actinobacteria bacterium OV450]
MTPYALAAPPPFVPDNCQNGPGDWSAVGSASAMSAFCGIFAGFVFAGVVVVIGEKNPPGGDGHASRGLRLLLPCFFGLAAASYLYALASGELVCLRATTEQLFSGAILAADAVVVIAGLAWLLPAYQRNRHGEVHFFRGLVQFAAQFSVLMLIVSSIGFDNAVLRRHASPWSDAASWVSGAALMLLVLLCWWRPAPPPPPPPPFAQDHWRDETTLNRRVSACAWTTLLLSGLLAVASGIAVGIPYEAWTDMPHWLVYALGEAGLLIPGAVVVAAVRSLPRP